MKARVLLLLLISASTAQAQTDAQLLKALGHMQHVPMAEIEQAAVDPETKTRVLNDERCGHPDFVDVEIAKSDAATVAQMLDIDEDFAAACVQMHSRMLQAVGAGSFPPRCNSLYPDNHSATYYVDLNSFPAHYTREVTDSEFQGLVDAKVWGVDTIAEARSKWDRGNLLETALALMDESFRRVGCAHIRFLDESKDHNIHILSKLIPGSVIGYAYYNDSTCTDHVTHTIDSSYKPGLHSLARLLTHESGHNHNLPHEFAGQGSHHSVMSYDPPRDNLFRGFFKGGDVLPADVSLGRLARYYGGEEVPVIGKPDPDPKPTPTGDFKIAIGDTITQVIDGREITYTVTKIQGDDGPTLGKQIAAALAAVPEYPKKEQDRQLLAVIYKAASESSLEDSEAQARLLRIRSSLISDEDKWDPILSLADNAPTKAGMNQVWEGLTGNANVGSILIKLLPVIIQLFSGGEVDWEQLIKILLTIFT